MLLLLKLTLNMSIEVAFEKIRVFFHQRKRNIVSSFHLGPVRETAARQADGGLLSQVERVTERRPTQHGL